MPEELAPWWYGAKIERDLNFDGVRARYVFGWVRTQPGITPARMQRLSWFVDVMELYN
jgi:hypothetical protein